MNFSDYRDQRLAWLLEQQRGSGEKPEYNSIAGLLELIEVAKPKSVVEIGSDEGISTEAFLLRVGRVIAVDPWSNENQYIKFSERCGHYPHLEIIRGTSPQALEIYQSREFDLVYIDADHGYGSVVEDIKVAKRISKRWIAGHDLKNGFPGIGQAVRELLGEPQIFPDTSWLIGVA